jgi:hypothetical protein
MTLEEARVLPARLVRVRRGVLYRNVLTVEGTVEQDEKTEKMKAQLRSESQVVSRSTQDGVGRQTVRSRGDGMSSCGVQRMILLGWRNISA